MAWTNVEYDGRVYGVPVTGRDENLNTMLTEIPGQDDVVTLNKLTDQRFYKFCMAFLMQDGNLQVPGGRYGTTTRSCAETAIIMSLIMQYHNGETITYYQLDSDMGSVVNSSDDVATMLYEWGELVFDGKGFGPLGNDGFDITDYLDADEIEELSANAES